MPSVQRLLDQRVTAAMRAAFPEAPEAPAICVLSQDARFGDYQANGAMALAKTVRRKPRDVAEAILARLDVADLCEKPEIAGPGFINLRLGADWVGRELGRINAVAEGAQDRLGVEAAARPETVVVDYSAPNLAKKMHVGHLRSTIIGDALVRMLEFAGHTVIRQNHIGDWGRQFGVVILGIWHLAMAGAGYVVDKWLTLKALKERRDKQGILAELTSIRNRHQQDLDRDLDGKGVFYPFLGKQLSSITLDTLLDAYRFVTLVETLSDGTGLEIYDRLYGVRTPLSEVSRRVVTYLQSIDPAKREQEKHAWLCATRGTLAACRALYERLGVRLADADVRGESAYNDDLPHIVEALRAKGLLTESEGAQCVFLKGPDGKDLFVAKDGSPLPLIVQKSDEGYLYATTDLAAIRYRCAGGGSMPHWGRPADRILYVVDARQSLHFQMVFECARQAGFAPPTVALEHVAFGTIMGPDGRPFKTREDDPADLMDLLDEAERRALDLVTNKNAQDAAAGRAEPLPDEQKRDIARKVGIGAVKYADLAQNRTSDYVFSWEKMLALDGNTAPYMQYACARVRSIFRKGGHEADALRHDASPIPVAAPQELALGKMLLRFPETLDRALEDYRPNILAAYLYDLAQAFTAFYDACPVLQSDEPLRTARLKLCDLTARVIARGLDLLGIETADRM